MGGKEKAEMALQSCLGSTEMGQGPGGHAGYMMPKSLMENIRHLHVMHALPPVYSRSSLDLVCCGMHWKLGVNRHQTVVQEREESLIHSQDPSCCFPSMVPWLLMGSWGPRVSHDLSHVDTHASTQVHAPAPWPRQLGCP